MRQHPPQWQHRHPRRTPPPNRVLQLLPVHVVAGHGPFVETCAVKPAAHPRTDLHTDRHVSTIIILISETKLHITIRKRINYRWLSNKLANNFLNI